MPIKSRMGIRADGFVSTPEGVPAIALAAGFEPGVSHGYPEFIEGCDAVVMGRSTSFWELAGLDRLELVVLPTLLGEGLPLSPQGAPPVPLTLLRADRTFPDGSAELVYTPA